MIATFEQYVPQALRDLKRVRLDTLLKRRYDRLRQWGGFFESASAKKTRAKPRDGSPVKGKSGSGDGTKANSGNGDGQARASRASNRKARSESDTPAK